MLTNNIFPIYDKQSKKIIDGYIYTKSNFCEKCSEDEHKKCLKYYENIDENINETYTCPYGLSTIVYNGNIVTSILINERFNKKTQNNLKNEIKNVVRFSETQAKELITRSIERDIKLEEYREAIHDLRNIASYFNSMIDEFKEENNENELSSTEKSLISLYELINFRLDVLSGRVDLTSIIEKEQKLHPIVTKLNHILKYKASQKSISVNIGSNQNNYFKITKSLYLSLFILLENSIKYSKPNNRIDVAFTEDSDSTVIKIRNVTSKMEEIDASTLIKKGVRGSNAKNSGQLGSGLGLALANDLLLKTGASLKIEINQHSSNESIFLAYITLNNPVKSDI